MVSTDPTASTFDKSEDSVLAGIESSFLSKMMKILTFFSDANDVTSHSIIFHKHRYVVRFNSCIY